MLISIVNGVSNTWRVQLHSEKFKNSLIIEPGDSRWMLDDSSSSEYRDRMRRLARGSELFQLLPLQKNKTIWNVFARQNPWIRLLVTSDRRTPRLMEVIIRPYELEVDRANTIIEFEMTHFDFKTKVSPDMAFSAPPAHEASKVERMPRYQRPWAI